MPRNSSGTYSLPSGNPVVTNTTITSAWANTTMTDVGSELTNSLDRNGRGAMLASLQLIDGTAGAPALKFANEPSTGIYRAGAGNPNLTILGTAILQWTSTGVNEGYNTGLGWIKALNSAAGYFRGFQWQTAGLTRWQFGANSTAESGSNTGSDLLLQSYSDAGALLGTVLTITRASGLITLGSGITITGPSYQLGPRNLLMNGGFDVWQRGTVFTTTFNSVSYSADRWLNVQPGAPVGTGTTQVTGVNGRYGLKMQRLAGSGVTNPMVLAQAIRSADCWNLAGKTVTLSFYAKAGANFSAAGGAMTVNIFTGTGTDQTANLMYQGSWTGTASPLATTQAITTNMVRYSFTVTLAAGITQAGVQLGWTPVGNAGADDSLTIEQVQLEIGNSMSGFELRHYQDILEDCQAYMTIIPSGGIIIYGNPSGSGQNVYAAAYPLKVSMRATPAVVAAPTWSTSNTGNGVVNSLSSEYVGYYATSAAAGFALTYNTLPIQLSADI